MTFIDYAHGVDELDAILDDPEPLMSEIKELEATVEPKTLAFYHLAYFKKRLAAHQRIRSGVMSEEDFERDWHRKDFDYERIAIGVDMVAFSVNLSHEDFSQEFIRATFPPPRVRDPKFPKVVGRLKQKEFIFTVSRYGYGQDHYLKIRFNPATRYEGHNLKLESRDYLYDSLGSMLDVLFDLRLLSVANQLRLVELHLARDVIFHHWWRNVKIEQRRVQDVLRFLSWSVPPRSRMVRVYDDALKKEEDDDEEVVEEGLKGATKSWEWTIYDKTLEYEQKGKDTSCVTGRILRIEWKLKNKKQISKHLGIIGPDDLIDFLGQKGNRDLEDLFDRHLKAAYFVPFKPYGQRLPRVPKAVVEGMKEWFVSPREQAIYGHLMSGQPILREDVDFFVQVLNKANPDRVRALVRTVYDMDGPAKARKEKAYDRCRTMLMRLRQDSSWSPMNSWQEKKEEIWRLIT